MSTWLVRPGRDGVQGYHDIDADIDSATLEALPHGFMQHHAFHPHMWAERDRVMVTTTDAGRYAGVVADVSRVTGNVLIKLETKPA